MYFATSRLRIALIGLSKKSNIAMQRQPLASIDDRLSASALLGGLEQVCGRGVPELHTPPPQLFWAAWSKFAAVACPNSTATSSAVRAASLLAPNPEDSTAGSKPFWKRERTNMCN